ncbi:Small-conductance mechanosensitive channel [Palleronia salina]|uniref:Small-conductance mechanosensitive channel n=1 Tax=Palleronia salina TaxID=313368 RepID=A0A1M6BR09_9RHOB|nr:mechanosensitive ion channel family protein [Palleronia salina]SHI51107.1 Small-conductance mechanosensitive channel [Palleronia salina]
MDFDLSETLTSALPEQWALHLTDGVSALIVLSLAACAALLLHALLYRVLLARIEKRFGMTRSLLRRARRPLSVAFVLASLIFTVPRTNLDRQVEDVIEHAALVLLIVLVGWLLIVLTNHFADRSTRRFNLDVDDNLGARKHVTQLRLLKRTTNIIIVLVTAGAALLTFEGVREYGVSLFASAGAAGLVLGLAARPVLTNLIAGIQIAITQPIRLEDVVIVEGEWGWVEEIFATFVVVRVWDRRRMVVPLSYFIEQPFQNWTRESAQVIGAVTWNLDYTVPVQRMRDKLNEFLEESSLWDHDVANLQVVETGEKSVKIRALMTARTSPRVWDLRCEVREKMLEWLRDAYPQALPRMRGELEVDDARQSGETPSDGGQDRNETRDQQSERSA